MEILTLKRLQHYVPASNESSEEKGRKLINVAFSHHEPHQNGSLLNKDLMNPSLSGLTFEGNNLSEYFGLAMAICAVGLLRNACPGPEASNNKLLKEAAQDRSGEGAVFPFEHLVANTVVSDKEKYPHNKAEHSIISQKIAHLQIELSELKRLRSEDGKANERVVSIFASKEQDWKIERRKLREEQHKLYQELQRAFLQQEALRSQMEHTRSLQKEPCPECERREGIFVEVKQRLGEQEFLIMTTMEEVQIERQEKNAIAEKLAAVELSVAMHEDLMKQLESRAKQVESDNSRILLELDASQKHLSAITDEKNHCKERISVISREINQLQDSLQCKDGIISAMLKRANADAEDRKELEKELAFMKAKLDHAEREKQKWRQLAQMNARSSSNKETFKPRSSFESRSVVLAIDDLQTLHDAEIKSLQTVFEEHAQMLQRRLSMYRERVADLEADILLSLTNTKRMIRYDEHGSSIHADIVGNECISGLHECFEAELASKQFQLSVAKTLIKQFMDSEADREQEVERWKKLYFASKATMGFHKEKEYLGTAIVPRSPQLQDWLKIEKSCHTYKLEKRHWQEIDAFERQMRARDERMEAFRWQLLQMGNEVQKTHRQLEILKQNLATAYDDKRTLEGILEQKEDELVACHEKALLAYSSCGCDNNHKEEISNLQEKVTSLQTMLMEREIEYELSLAKASSQAECELGDAECKLAVAKAQLVQAHNTHEEERKEKEKLLLELHRDTILLEHECQLENEAQKKFQAALPRLPTRICRAQAQATLGDDMGQQFKELVEHSSILSLES